MNELYGVATVTDALIATILVLGNSQKVVAAPPTGVKSWEAGADEALDLLIRPAGWPQCGR
jgi:hypothetical protein